MDWDFNDDYTEQIVFGLTWVLIIGLIVVCLFGLLLYSGYESDYIGTLGLVSVGIFIILLLTGIFFYQRWMTHQNYQTIRDKARRRIYRPLDYEYGRNSQELAQRFQVRRSQVLTRIGPESLQELWEVLMVQSPHQVPQLLTELLGDYPRDTPDVQYNLLWYLCIAAEPLRNNLSRAEIRYVLGLDQTQLLQLVQDGIRPIPTVESTYDGLTDRASLIFTLLSGYFVPRVDIPRYATIKNYSPHIVYNLAFNQNSIINHQAGVYNIYPPHLYVAQQPESAVETIIARISPTNCDELIATYQIAPLESVRSKPYAEKEQLLQRELTLYYNVFTRPESMALPPDLANLTDPEIYTILSYYTNLELIQHYEPRFIPRDRNHLLRIIHDDIVGIPKWSIQSIQYCSNDATMNVITGEAHGDVRKDDPDDPTLSYGRQKDYTCYQASELEGAFRDYNGIFQFQIPDSITPATFPIESIKQLRDLLQESDRNIDSLRRQIEHGLRLMKTAQVQTHLFKQEYDTFTAEQQAIIRRYFAWMFVYSMWMRFWKGPGHPWPLKKVSVGFALTRAIGQRASPKERDEHVFIQETVRSRLIESFETDPVLNRWITTLPAVHYDFETADSHCASYTIKEKMDIIATGSECMGFGADTILKTSYYYILYLLGVAPGPSFDSFIYHQLPAILQLERDVIETQQRTVLGRDNQLRTQVMHDRLEALSQSLPIQPAFDPSLYQTNVHVD